MTLADEYGEDPARFLARPMPSSLETIRARIRGIQIVDEDAIDWSEILRLALGLGFRQAEPDVFDLLGDTVCEQATKGL